MNLNFMTGFQTGASQGAPSGDAVAAGAPSQAASPFAALLAILAGTQAEVQPKAQPAAAPEVQAPELAQMASPALSQQSVQRSQPPIAPQGQAGAMPIQARLAMLVIDAKSSQPAQVAFASPAQIETKTEKPDDKVRVEAPIEAAIALPEQNPQSVPAAPELLAVPPVVVFSGEPADAAGAQSEHEEPVAAPLPDQPRPDLPVGAAVPSEPVLAPSQGANAVAPAQPSELQSSMPSLLQPQPQSPPPDGQPAGPAQAETAKADVATSSIAAVDPKIAGAAANDGQGPTSPADKADDAALPQQALDRKQAETIRPNAPVHDAAKKPDVALDVDASGNRPAPPAPADALKPAELRAADVTPRSPEPVAAAPSNARQADAAAPRPAPVPAQNPAPQVQAAVPIEGLAIQIARVAKSGERKFEIRLDPPELGKVSIRLDVSREGVVTTHLTVERAETMDLLQRDARALERALGQAGLDQKSGGISFSLSDQNTHPQQDGRDAPRHAYPMASDETLSADAPAQPARFRSADSLLDIRI